MTASTPQTDAARALDTVAAALSQHQQAGGRDIAIGLAFVHRGGELLAESTDQVTAGAALRQLAAEIDPPLVPDAGEKAGAAELHATAKGAIERANATVDWYGGQIKVVVAVVVEAIAAIDAGDAELAKAVLQSLPVQLSRTGN
jgi:hypothetical protein